MKNILKWIGIIVIVFGIIGSICLAYYFGIVVDFEFYSRTYYKRDMALTLGYFLGGSASSVFVGCIFFGMSEVLESLENIQNSLINNTAKIEKKMDDFINTISNTNEIHNQADAKAECTIEQENTVNEVTDEIKSVQDRSDNTKEYENEFNRFKTLTELYEYVQKETFPIGAETRIKNMILEIKKRAPQDDDSESLKQAYTVICNYRELCKQVISGTFSFKEKNGEVRCPICDDRIRNVEEKSCCFTCGFKWKI